MSDGKLAVFKGLSGDKFSIGNLGSAPLIRLDEQIHLR
jgi:hypothetical protein